MTEFQHPLILTVEPKPTDPRVERMAQAGFNVDAETGGILFPLGGVKFPGMFAIVDEEDLPIILGWNWRPIAPNPGTDRPILYASCRISNEGNGKHIYMHRMILGVTDPTIKVDHKNHNGLDNRRANIRLATNAQNAANSRPLPGSTSRFKGVSWSTEKRKWVAQITINGKVTALGGFDDEIEAAKTVDRVARDVRGEYAYLNFPEEAA